jgi:hypothetical protein
MSVYQSLTAAKLLTTNRKGADTFSSTSNPNIDLFTLCSKDPYMSFDDFQFLCLKMNESIKTNPAKFFQLMMFQRNILHGNGIKHYYYLGMNLMLDCCLSDTTELGSNLIRHSYQYSKDLYHLGTKGIDIYYEKMQEQLIQLLTPNCTFDERYDPMLFKYLSYEGGKWEKEMKRIQQNFAYNDFLMIPGVEDLIYSKEPLSKPIGEEIRELFLQQVTKTSSNLFTNRVMRKLKALFNKENHLPEYLFAGKHYDGTDFILMHSKGPDDKCEFLQSEIDKIAKEISQTAGIATTLLSKTIQRWIDDVVELEYNEEEEIFERKLKVLTLRQQLLIEGFKKYKANITKGEVVVKEVGVELSDLAYNYFMGLNSDGIILEQQLLARIERLKKQWTACFNDEYTMEDFTNSFEVIVDRSGSMEGTPIETAMLYLVIMTKIFRLKHIIYFDTDHQLVNLTNKDIDGSILDLIKKVYTRTQFSTNLGSAFHMLESRKESNKNVLIITDSDCDPIDSQTKSAFHYAFDKKQTSYLHTNKYIVMNVSVEKMSFPYLSFHENVSYVNGTSTISFLIEALILSRMNRLPFTPELVLECCLNSSKFAVPEDIRRMLNDSETFDKSLLSTDSSYILEKYLRFRKSLPLTDNPKTHLGNIEL